MSDRKYDEWAEKLLDAQIAAARAEKIAKSAIKIAQQRKAKAEAIKWAYAESKFDGEIKKEIRN